MGRYKYSESEEETLKVLKMQQVELEHLDNDIQEDLSNGQNDAKEIDDLRKRAEVLLQRRGITPPTYRYNKY